MRLNSKGQVTISIDVREKLGESCLPTLELVTP